MMHLFRRTFLILLSLALVVGAAVFVLVPIWEESRIAKPIPLSVGEDEREIVWLNAATSTTPWERFVTGANQAVKRLNAETDGVHAEIDDSGAFPRETATTPQFTLKLKGGKRLVFRWYKLTSNSTTAQWTEALMQRRPPPLAIIGGSSSDLAIDLAKSLHGQSDKHSNISPPIILLTAATADRSLSSSSMDAQYINEIHPGRTFRFCFTNRRMAEAITEFIWGRPELQPDPGPVYVTMWRDDAYSLDLTDRFFEVLREKPPAQIGTIENLPIPEYVDYSVGPFDQPNRWEEPVVRQLMETKLLRQNAKQTRPLLILPGASAQPMRRFLRGIMRTAPEEARQFVVATGDGLAFNAVYRDRRVLWPIQDLPFDLVLFCHRNPIDADAGFQPEETPSLADPNRGSPTTGTEDLLLNHDIIEALAQAVSHADAFPASGDDLARSLKKVRWNLDRIDMNSDRPLLFDDKGNRASGTGEHLVWIQPQLEGSRVQARSKIAVFTGGKPWQSVGKPLLVDYDLSKTDQ